jgi:hypothetical protein
MNNRTNKFDQELKSIKHFQNHPQMIPFIGNQWGKKHKKILIVAESHYIENRNIDVYREIVNNWYDTHYSKLSENDKIWTSTADIIDNSKYLEGGESNGHRIYLHLDKALIESGLDRINNEKMFQYVSFMNFFQRPADSESESIIVNQKDQQIANETLKEVINVIKPEFVFFVSSNAWEFYDKSIFDKTKTGHSCHPISKWWNRKASCYTDVNNLGKLTGKESFVNFIKKNQVFNNKI